MSGGEWLPDRRKAADDLKKLLMRYPDANGIGRQYLQGWAQPASILHRHPGTQPDLYCLAGKFMDGRTGCVGRRDRDRPIPK